VGEPTASGFWRRPGAAAIAIAVVCVPLILLLREAGVLVGLAGLCLYPFLDVPRILSRPSWWRAAAFSVLGWIGLFIAIMAATESVRHLGEDAWSSCCPSCSTRSRLRFRASFDWEVGSQERRKIARATRRPHRRSCVRVVRRRAARVEHDSRRHHGAHRELGAELEYADEGEVLSATPGQVTVRLDRAETEVFRLGPDTTFAFQGPGWKMVEGEPGPSWLKAPQRVGVHYVYRNRIAEAQSVNDLGRAERLRGQREVDGRDASARDVVAGGRDPDWNDVGECHWS
jgi:hypothetical protein